MQVVYRNLPDLGNEKRMSSSGNDAQCDGEWDAGETGCGELVLFLRKHLAALPAGGVLRVRALDAGAIEDIPAWCRITANTLVRMEPPYYYIKRKETE